MPRAAAAQLDLDQGASLADSEAGVGAPAIRTLPMRLSTKSPVATWQAGGIRGTLARYLLSMPFVYGLLLPIALLDAAVSFYQAVCFRLWRIPRAHRSSHLILDRHKLTYLNGPQRLNCLYCGYATGILSYAREISARTEQYWCPIKHAVEPSAPHARYASFIEYADAQGFATRSAQLRAAVQSPQRPAPSPRVRTSQLAK